MTDLTPIPEGFKITVCPPGNAHGIEPPICRSTGRCGAPAAIFGDKVAGMVLGKRKPKQEPETVIKAREKKYHRDYMKEYRKLKKELRAKAEEIFNVT